MHLRILFVGISLTLFGRSAGADEAEKTHFFETRIRPVLVETCLRCHGEKLQKGDLRLDSKAAVLKGGASGPAVIPGKAQDSLLLKAIRHVDPALKMPPVEVKLADAIIADFEKWIAMGAPDPRDGKTPTVSGGITWKEARTFWSFQSPTLPALPSVRDETWIKTPIDRFIRAKLEAEGVQPMRPATNIELIRRATFDLTGLPPTPEEVEAFVQDRSPEAFDRVVDRLLQSPHYGERWGRYWLDVGRYAEDQAHSFAVVPNTNAWRYRDWVIAALNADMPYDRFVKLQIAADLIERDDAGRIQHLSALGFFGLGAQYYKDVAQVFNNEAAKALADELDDRIDTLTRGFLGLTVSCARCHDHKYDPIPQLDYYSLAGVFRSCEIANVTLADQATQDRVKKHLERIQQVDEAAKALVRRENTALAERFKPDVARYLLATRHYLIARKQQASLTVAQYGQQENLGAEYLDRFLEGLKKGPGGSMVNVFRRYTEQEEEKAVTFAKDFEQRVHDAMTRRDKKVPLDKVQTDIVAWLFGDVGIFAPSEELLRSKLTPEKIHRRDELKAELKKLESADDAKPLPIAHGLKELSPTDMNVYLRGNPATPGDLAPRRFLRVLGGDEPKRFTQGSGRLELAEAIASKDNPLTARVMVNRIWQHHFGRGLVGSPSNFGTLGKKPTHPELLDYLACRLVESGWSIKALHREIMRSAVYQLSCDRRDVNLNRDGDNRWLWRMNRRRLDVESFRDTLLAVAGKLDLKLGGPTTNLADADNCRRTVYAKISRHDLNGLLRIFDFPDPNITSERRNETTVPQQQLFVLNNPFVIETARAFAARVEKEAGSDAERVQRALKLAYGRPAMDAETRLFLAFLGEKDTPEEATANRLSRMERLALILFGTNEFMYVD